MRLLLAGLLVALAARAACAQFKDESNVKGATLGAENTLRIRLGVIVKARGLTFRGVAAVPVPAEWPEQQVRVVAEDVSPAVRNLTYRTLAGGGGIKQMVVEIPQLPAGQEAKALVTFEVARHELVAPKDTTRYAIPKKVPRDLMLNLGPSPFIESRHPKIVAPAKEAVEGVEGDWKKVEAIYDWTRNNVAYRNGDLKGAARALIDKEGYTDDVTSVFIAMCRAQRIPARTVFVPGHCYAEFYLEDEEGQGHWFACNVAGDRQFGGIREMRPILQKGDNFKNPEEPKERLRWLKEDFHASGRGASPVVQFVCEPVAE